MTNEPAEKSDLDAASAATLDHVVQHDPPQPPSNFVFGGFSFHLATATVTRCSATGTACSAIHNANPTSDLGPDQVLLPSRGWWPELRAMKQPQHLDALRAFEPVDQNERRAADDQLASAFDAPRPAHLGVVIQHLDLALDLVVLIGCGGGVVFGDVVELVEAVPNGLWKPLDDQTEFPLSLVAADAVRARQAARRFAPSAMAASFDTH